jgi:hypothetical protein
MTKIVYDACFGGFRLLLSEAMQRSARIKGWTFMDKESDIAAYSYSRVVDPQRKEYSQYDLDDDRTDRVLVQVIEELGALANGWATNLQIADTPRGTRYRIDEYDGNESVMTMDDYDWKVA